jgi:hypothetical protein
MTTTTINDIVTSLHQQDVIADYHRIPDGNTRIDLADGRRRRGDRLHLDGLHRRRRRRGRTRHR